jgi:hypothetical protein
VSDRRGVEWIVKLGPEAQAETSATRLVWAVGYGAEEAYYLQRVRIQGLPELSRGEEFVQPGGYVLGARFEPRRAGAVRGDNWKWDENPFVGTRELNGLRTLMVLLNNWDARPENNHVVTVRDRRGRSQVRYFVSDLGATFGRTGGWGEHSKNDVEDFSASPFVEGVEGGMVKFDFSTRPSGIALASVAYPPYFLREWSRERHFREVPLEHARWMGRLLSRLSAAQLGSAFAAAGYSKAETDRYVRALRARIRVLASLQQGTQVSNRQ